jgi:glyoxylase-like metal-dependent hydrolase (beta-lactamase superfamily II)
VGARNAIVGLAFGGSAAAAMVAIGRRPRRSAPAGGVPREIAPQVFCLGPWGHTQTNAYLVQAGSTSVLIDAGWEGDAARIEGAARSLLGPGAAPAAILLSHVHPDHAGAARSLAELWRCPILLHPAEAPIADGDVSAMERFAGPLDRWVILPLMRCMGERRRAQMLARTSLAGLARELDPGGAIPDLDGWSWIHVPGHTPGSVAYVRTADRVVLTGDALVSLRVNVPSGVLLGRQGLSGPPWYTTWDRRAAVSSIGRIASLEPSVIGTGHGHPLTGPGTAASVRAFAASLDRADRPV